ncbi:unnamed protein product [Mytilus coruscus]|uniref:C2H2-type domain-containing protein n=1 Tax=Mytilus coruscus TaxID=42192 RepID=A0A6J8EHI2_MYTCO|nr:unnamed protein product [Mytilus coruscus]
MLVSACSTFIGCSLFRRGTRDGNTTKKPRWIYPVCQVRFETEKDLEDHVLACVKKRSAEEEFLCDICPYTTSRKSDFMRHQRRSHPKSLSTIEDTDSEWEKQNPRTLSDVIGESSRAKTEDNAQEIHVSKMPANTMTATTATIVAPPLANSFLVPRMVEMDVECITTTTTGTIPIPAQVARPAATYGLILVERRFVRRYKENGKDVEETENLGKVNETDDVNMQTSWPVIAAEEAVDSRRSIGYKVKHWLQGEAVVASKADSDQEVDNKQWPQVKHWLSKVR